MMPFWESGQLDERIDIEREIATNDGLGGTTYTLTNLASVWAHVKPLGGSELERFDQVTAEQQYLFVIRRGVDVKHNDQITWQGAKFNVRRIDDRGPRTHYIEIMAQAGVAQ